ncbi:MAG: protein YgfX [Gammaproteobacteria bacterium]
MSSPGFAAPLRCAPESSHFLDHLNATVHALVGCAVCAVRWPPEGEILLLVSLVLVLGSFRHWVRRLSRAFELHWPLDTGARLIYPQTGEEHRVTVLPGALITPWGVLLTLADERGRRHSLVIAYDALRPEDFRRLRVRTRLNSGGG